METTGQCTRRLIDFEMLRENRDIIPLFSLRDHFCRVRIEVAKSNMAHFIYFFPELLTIHTKTDKNRTKMKR